MQNGRVFPNQNDGHNRQSPPPSTETTPSKGGNCGPQETEHAPRRRSHVAVSAALVAPSIGVTQRRLQEREARDQVAPSLAKPGSTEHGGRRLGVLAAESSPRATPDSSRRNPAGDGDTRGAQRDGRAHCGRRAQARHNRPQPEKKARSD